MRNATARAAALGSSPDDPILESTWDVFPVAIKDAPVPANARVTWANFANQSNSVATFDVSSNVIAPYVQLDSTLAGRCAAVLLGGGCVGLRASPLCMLCCGEARSCSGSATVPLRRHAGHGLQKKRGVYPPGMHARSHSARQ